MTDKKEGREKITTSAQYRGATIHCTNKGNYIVVVSNVHYPAGRDLSGAKSMIDDMIKARSN